MSTSAINMDCWLVVALEKHIGQGDVVPAFEVVGIQYDLREAERMAKYYKVEYELRVVVVKAVDIA